MEFVAGFDLGGTKLSTALVDETLRVKHRSWLEHAADSYADVLDIVSAEVVRCRDVAAGLDGTVAAVGLSLAGWLTPDRQGVRAAVNLGVREQPIRADLQARLQVPVTIENDGNAAALAEARLGAGVGARSMVFVALGTGVGGGVVVDGRLLRGGRGLAGELGHAPVSDRGLECTCGGHDCLELFASGPALAAAAGTATSREVVSAALTGDSLAATLVTAAGSYIGRALRSTIATLDPDVVLLGGSLAFAASSLLIPEIRRALGVGRPLSGILPAPDVRLAALGPEAAAIGAASLAHELIFPPNKELTT